MSKYDDLWYESADGLSLYARDYPCTNPEISESQVVLCMHGLTRNSADFAGLAEHLSGSYRVVSVDQRGRGKSDYDTVVGNYTPLTYVGDMFVLLDKLKLDKVALIGTSMGGLMAFIMAAMQGQRVRAMVINDIGPDVDPAGIERIKSYVGKAKPVTNWSEAIDQSKFLNGPAFPDFSDQQWSDFTHAVFNDDNGTPVLAYDPAIAQPMADKNSGAVPPDLWPVFDASAAIPTLVIRGELSDILAPACVAEMQARRADLHYVEVPRRGHAPTLDEPECRYAIDQFLRPL